MRPVLRQVVQHTRHTEDVDVRHIALLRRRDGRLGERLQHGMCAPLVGLQVHPVMIAVGVDRRPDQPGVRAEDGAGPRQDGEDPVMVSFDGPGGFDRVARLPVADIDDNLQYTVSLVS